MMLLNVLFNCLKTISGKHLIMNILIKEVHGWSSLLLLKYYLSIKVVSNL